MSLCWNSGSDSPTRNFLHDVRYEFYRDSREKGLLLFALLARIAFCEKKKWA